MDIRHLYISAGNNFFGHHGRPPDTHPAVEVPEIECVAGHGIKGDRFFDYRQNYKGQITFFSLEIFGELCAALGARDCSPGAVRRNVVTSGVDLLELIGRDFEVQGVRLRGTEHCRPCYWMDQAVAAGAEEFLKQKNAGGLRARILSDGVIRTGNR